VRVEVDETDVTKIRENQAAYVTAEAYGEQKFAARVVRIAQNSRAQKNPHRPTNRTS
jgi:HlyD family secretion protein